MQFCDTSLGRRAILIFLVKAGVAAFEADFLAGEPHAFDVGANVENVPIGGEESSFLADLNRAEAIGYAGELRGIKREAFEGFGFGQTESDGLRGRIRQVARQRRIEAV